MTDMRPHPEAEDENESYPVEPRYHPIHKIPRKIYDFLASAKLAMALLVIILSCCLAGVTIWRGAEAGRLIFGALWFNGLLVLLVINVACCFFGRIWGRRVTVVSFGMILFHISFVVILLSIVYNSLFYFRGIIRLTEGEALPSSDLQSYDLIDKGRFFSFTRLRGETALIKMHTGYKVSGEDKRAAYEVSVGEENNRKHGIIYITHKLSHRGVDYFNEKEGYSLLLMLSDKLGRDLYGVHVPLQSIVLGKDRFEYSTGYKDNEGKVNKDVIPFPALPERPLFALKTEYMPSKLKERSGDVWFQVFPLGEDGYPNFNKPLAEGKAAVGETFIAGEYLLTATEVRYWVGMTVRYEPGKPIVLASLWIGLAGMVITTVGRMMRRKKV
ncbi:MAG: hypothetical protein AB1306_02055 [Nitrospirota bacterium]